MSSAGIKLMDSRYDGQVLKQAFKQAETTLEKKIDELNALNVFPVPDGDTGINMYLTMQSATRAVADVSTKSAAEISAKVARGALLGARGNSGVILSQILRGLARGLEKKDYFTTLDFAQSLCYASDIAYKSMLQPVEGTIITVVREASEVASRHAAKGAGLEETMSAIVVQAGETVRRTPEMLPKLKEAGVVDAGGKGLYYIFLGMKNFFFRKTADTTGTENAYLKAGISSCTPIYGFDLQFLVEGDNLSLEEMRSQINNMGESVLVVGDERLLRVHIHTCEPQIVLDYSSRRGQLKDIVMENLDKQVADFRKLDNGENP
jgi:uncharacterized protein